MILDFKEIPQANKATGEQDKFEFFAREFLVMMGYTILQDPNRGPDRGKDMIVSQRLQSKETIYDIKWLVSCKHKVHSGKSVDRNDERDITDRLLKNKCTGFMGFYSTPAASTLADTIYSLNSHETLRLHGLIYDPEKIERYLFDSKGKGWDIISRYFSNFYQTHKEKNPGPVLIYDNQSPILCEISNKDMFSDKGVGCVAYIYKDSYNEKEFGKQEFTEHLVNVIVCKKIYLDDIERREKVKGNMVNFVEFDDFCNPYKWIKTLFNFIVELQRGYTTMPNAVFDKMTNIFMRTFPFVARAMTDKEKEEARSFAMLENIIL